jgi:hypothetical protein
MLHKFFCLAVPIAILSVALATPARADQWKTDAEEVVAGIVAVTAIVAVLVTVLILHHKNKKTSITGCVSTETSGMSITDTKDQRKYVLGGDTSAIRPGDRMTLEGRRKKSGDQPIFEARSVTQDLGACKP